MRRRDFALGVLATMASVGLTPAHAEPATPPEVYTKAQYKEGRTEAFNDGYDIGLGVGRNRAADERVSQAAVVGALYDFMGWLTTREEPITVSRSHTVYALMDSFQEWAKARGLDINKADVEGWLSRVDPDMKAVPYVSWVWLGQDGLKGDWAYVGNIPDPHVKALELARRHFVGEMGRDPLPTDKLLLQVGRQRVLVNHDGPRWASLPGWEE